MGLAKHHMEDMQSRAEAEWSTKVEENSYRCIRCGNEPQEHEKEIFLETGMCEFCDNQADKD